MAVLPYRKIELYSPLPAEAVALALGNAVEPKRWLRFGAGSRPFEGAVTQSSFDIRRIISYRNSFVPQIRGTIAPEGGGSRISITMQLHLAVAIFMTLWLSAVFLAVIASAPAVLSGRAELATALVPLGMFLFGSILTVASFSIEARKAERLLASLLDGARRPVDTTREKPPGFF